MMKYDGTKEQLICEHNRLKAQLEESLQAMRDIVDSIPSGLFIYQYEKPDDTQGRTMVMISANKASEDMTGIPVDEVIGFPLCQYLRAFMLTFVCNFWPFLISS